MWCIRGDKLIAMTIFLVVCNMSNLKSFLWKNKTSVSIKRKNYAKEVFQLTQWPDFGFVGCPADYITISSHLIKKPLTFQQINQLTDASESDVNHYIYVCRMLQIIDVKPNLGTSRQPIKLFSDAFTSKLRALFFNSLRYEK